MNRSRNRTGYTLPAVLFFAGLLLCLGLICAVLFGTRAYAGFSRNIAGTGIYNTFFMNATVAADTDVRLLAEPQPQPVVDETMKVFGSIHHSRHYALLRLSDGKVLMEQDADTVIFPASLTKIMTAIVTIDSGQSLDTDVRITSDILEYCWEQNAAVAGFASGDVISVRDLLYATLLSSGADACIALARQVTATEINYGTEAEFVELMNQKAAELGMNDTHFVTCTGLHDDAHVSSIRDLVTMFTYALQNEQLKEIMTTLKYTTEPTRKHAEGLELTSTVYNAFRRANLDMGSVLGGKTGYTPEAGLCMATLARMNYAGEETELILVTAGAGDGSNSVQYHAMDAYSVFVSQSLRNEVDEYNQSLTQPKETEPEEPAA